MNAFVPCHSYAPKSVWKSSVSVYHGMCSQPIRAFTRSISGCGARGEGDSGLLIGSFVHYRILFRHASASDNEIERAVEALLQGIARDYPRLLEHSRMMTAVAEPH